MTDLIDRCAAHGWTLRPDGDGYELIGNGQPASFRSEESVRVWLEKQRAPTVKLPTFEAMRNQIMTGDARILAAQIPDQSIDLIFTDPIYSEQPLYDLLASIALRVLKPHGAVLCWSNGKWHRQNANWLEAAGLTYRYDFGCVITTGNAPMNGKIISKTNRLIWLDIDSQSKMRGYLADGYASAVWSRLHSEWAWTKNPIYCEQAINVFAPANAFILDPYAGHATIPSVAKVAGRDYIGFEIDPERADKARQRLEHTQAIDPVFLEEQVPLFAESD